MSKVPLEVGALDAPPDERSTRAASKVQGLLEIKDTHALGSYGRAMHRSIGPS